MKASLILCGALVLAVCLAISAEEQARHGSATLSDAVVLIIRHAEKPESGQGLAPAGEQRAQAYVDYFKTFKVDSRPLVLTHLYAAADSEASHRPRLTVEPLGKALGLKVDDRFPHKKAEQLAEDLRMKDHGKGILICWHHGAMPELLQALGVQPGTVLPKGAWPDKIFGWVIELRFDHEGRLIPGETKRIVENF